MTMLDEASSRARPPQSSRIHCLLCDYDLTSAAVDGHCSECGEPVMRSFAWPHEDGVTLPVPCARCGHKLGSEHVDGRCAQCAYPVIRTLNGPRQTDPNSPAAAPMALITGLMTIPFAFFLPVGAAIFALTSCALFGISCLEYRRGASSRSALAAAAAGALVSVFWLANYMFNLVGVAK